jgi:hypothetical protein
LLTLTPLFRGVEEKSRDMYDRSQLEHVFAVMVLCGSGNVC